MKKNIVLVALAAGLFAGAGSNAASAETSGRPGFTFNINATICYNAGVATYNSGFYSYAPIKLAVNTKTIIELLNASGYARHVIADYNDTDQIPAGSYIVFDGISGAYDNGGTGGHLAIVDANGFYLPLEGYSYYYGEDYYFADLYVPNQGYLVGSSTQKASDSSFTESDVSDFYFYFNSYGGNEGGAEFNFDIHGAWSLNLTGAAAYNGGMPTFSAKSILFKPIYGTIQNISARGNGNGGGSAYINGYYGEANGTALISGNSLYPSYYFPLSWYWWDY